MKGIYNEMQKLRQYGGNGYWEKRIAAEIGYLFELFYEKEEKACKLLETAIKMLQEDYDKQEQIEVSTAKAVEALLMPLAEKAKGITVICAAHAHIDMNWMWGYQETVALTLDTVRTMLVLMEEYPEFVFSQSQASVYQMLEEYAPELLEQVKERIREGRWEVTASTWVENDKNMPGGESMARQLLYTKKYLSKLLNIPEEDLNLDYEPDTFGHSYNYPEILQKGGVTRYYHCRGYKGENIYRWRGMSGAEILSYREPRWYLGYIESHLCEGVPAFCEKYGINKILRVYGVGDHGGGPTRRDIERLLDMNSWPLYPTIKLGTYREFYDYLEEHKEQFPIVDQELNYVFTGCYTSQSRIKLANRVGEARLIEAEILESMARLEVPEYKDGIGMEAAWRKILFNQFHDILPGSGTIETREYAMGKFQEAMARAGANGVKAMTAICGQMLAEEKGRDAKDTAMGAGTGNGTEYVNGCGFPSAEMKGGAIRYLAVFNTTQAVRTEPTELILWDWKENIENIYVTDLDGNEYPVQILEHGEGYWDHEFWKVLVWMPVPALGYGICRVGIKEAKKLPVYTRQDPRMDYITDEPVCLENNLIKAVFDVPTMKCISFVSKADGREWIASEKPACGLMLLTEETKNEMTSWRVGKTGKAVDLNENCFVKCLKLQTEGFHKELEYKIEDEETNILVKVSLDEGSAMLNFQLKVVWTKLGSLEKGIPQLRFMLPVGYESEKYRYTIPYGVIERRPLAQDVPAIGLGCAVPKNGKNAIYMLSNCKYGFRGDKDGLSLNLIRSSYEPDEYPEVGEHNIRIGVGIGAFSEENLALLSERYIHPVIVRSCAGTPKTAKKTASLFWIEGGVLSTIKGAEDKEGWIVRIYNPAGEKKLLKLCLPGHSIDVRQCDILERNIAFTTIRNNCLEYQMKAHEVCCFRINVR